MTGPRLRLCLYLAAVVTITFVHDPLALALILAAALAATGRDALAILKPALLAVAFVNVAITSGYIALSLWHGEPWLTFVLRLNLRVLLLAILTLWLARRVDLVAALGFSRSLRFLIVVAMSQILSLRRLLNDYGLALQSRTPGRPRLRHRYRNAASQAAALMDKTTAQAEDLTMGMRSRGVFDDRR